MEKAFVITYNIKYREIILSTPTRIKSYANTAVFLTVKS